MFWMALQGRHEVLSLRSAMVQFYKLENFATAAIFARRLLEKTQTPAQVPTCTPTSFSRMGGTCSGTNMQATRPVLE